MYASACWCECECVCVRKPCAHWRGPCGQTQVSKIETEKLLFDTISHELRAATAAGTYTGKFDAQFHFFGCVCSWARAPERVRGLGPG